MTVTAAENGTIQLTGSCGAEQAEQLLELLVAERRPVDLTGCEHLHTTLVQILLAARAQVAPGGAPLLVPWLSRLLDGKEPGAASASK